MRRAPQYIQKSTSHRVTDIIKRKHWKDTDMNRFFHNILSAVAAVAAMALGGAATSCTMIEDDVTDCPTGL